MNTDKKKELLEETYDKVIHMGFCVIPYEDLSHTFAKDMIAFGTTKDELMRSFDEMDALFKSQFEQLGDIVPSLKRERIATQFSPDENQVIISEILEMTIKTEEFTNTLILRTSAVLHWVMDKWIFVHFHASSPVNTENDHWHLDEWKKENERLQKLVDHQTADLRQKNDELELKRVELEENHDKLQKSLQNLKSAQAQLVQQEKLASLGQLTAGIAHEIKNPLNFVNNFSEVSLEMIDEALEEARQVGDNPHAQETIAILTDIKANLTKIHEHGSRADGIVKSMLMHSRGGTGSAEPTDLNALVREYVNLAFHGMRAGKHPINVDIDLDLDETIGQVPLIAEDFSRVILNMCNNAFDAMREKGQVKRDKSEEFAAKLSVRTKRDGDRVTFEIEDNGVGIPDEIKDKILQPFFTTKKGTQGTGLGLSITHDIIKAHGGSMDVLSKPGKTTFAIHLG